MIEVHGRADEPPPSDPMRVIIADAERTMRADPRFGVSASTAGDPGFVFVPRG